MKDYEDFLKDLEVNKKCVLVQIELKRIFL